MKFKLLKILNGGKYIVQPILAEFNKADEEKVQKHGIPKLKIRSANGSETIVSIKNLDLYGHFAFFNQSDADTYYSNIKSQLKEIKDKWESIEDDWSSEEDI
ncbi:hypothetical protein [Leptospira bandrabouensis]|uniref:hypothetical protein n=1 Tax=Leptospira bandrabouensis TaxID=2484903 RepID=UPI001EEBB781|nr:hypothetical protein [Leptospira bandrabouensis]MCG6154113.1 hypothetical protein [Leptospira bandrabouensis]